jgi:aspartate 1-decarboxylase
MVGDIVVIISYASMPFDDAKGFKPSIAFPKEGNKL